MPNPDPSPKGPAFRFLHVEDNPDDAFFARHAFRKAAPEIQLLAVSDGKEAQDYLLGAAPFHDRSTHPLPDLLLMDLKLPKMTGLEVLGWMKARPELKDIPVFILSSSSEKSDVESAGLLGAKGYFSKPGSVKALTEIVQKLLDFLSAAGKPSTVDSARS
ncbi:MAG TPA: response regulator [Planctomycetota bacterium]|nr:response regulator [Planctomycetota bacterium]